MPKCYMCDADSTSVEHAPAKSFFPTGIRTNLITVPACRVHNEDTSRDDEYVRNIVTMLIENNQTSINHFFDKSLRSFQRNPALAAEIRNSLKDVSYNDINAKSFQLDRPRLDRIIRKIAYALFYNEFGYTWERLLAVCTNQIKTSDLVNDHLGDMFEELSEPLNEMITNGELTLKGENPLVFQYTILDFGKGIHDKAIFMIFYEGFPFWIIPQVDSTSNSFD